MTAVTTSHIVLDDKGRAYIEGARTRVAMIVMDKLNGLAPEQIHQAYPYLGISRIYAALAYYYDHQADLDAETAGESRQIESARTQAIAAGHPPSRKELEQRLADRGNRP